MTSAAMEIWTFLKELSTLNVKAKCADRDFSLNVRVPYIKKCYYHKIEHIF